MDKSDRTCKLTEREVMWRPVDDATCK